MYDTHSHLNFKAFAKDYYQVIKNSLKAGLKLNLVGSDINTSRRAVEIAEEYPSQPVYAAVGLHPSHVGKIANACPISRRRVKCLPDLPARAGPSDIRAGKQAGQMSNVMLNGKYREDKVNKTESQELKQEDRIHSWNYVKYKELALHHKVVAIGETGLDYYRLTDNITNEAKQFQKQIFLEHFKLATDVKKPLIIHCRPSTNTFDAYKSILDILTSIKNQSLLYKDKFPNLACRQTGFLILPVGRQVFQFPVSGVIHCFVGNWAIAQQFLALGFYISFTGIITYKNIDDYLLEVIKKIPLSRIMLETDCPYLAPEPVRVKRNLPLNLKYIAQKVAEIKNISYDEVVRLTDENAKRLFNL